MTRVVFFHPDLGIGGAERLIVDAALGLQNQDDYQVTIFTSHRDPRHCFDEARDGSLDVRVRGNGIFPTSILGRFHLLCAILRQIHLLLAITLFSRELSNLNPSIFIVDQLSACVPFLRWLYPDHQRILFYCHFPDQLLATHSTGLAGLIKRAYRLPFDWYEGWSMSASDQIVVNSRFTKSVARRIFPGLPHDLGVIYPCVQPPPAPPDPTADDDNTEPLWPDKNYLLSINRFERKKSIETAIRAYHALPSPLKRTTRLVLAGGHDPRNRENTAYHNDLIFIASSLGLSTATARSVPTALAVPPDIQVLFLLSVPAALKATLLRHARLLLYTPPNEHFGIAPVEAMAHGVPVLACDSGGPLETVVEGETGWLRGPARVDDWAEVMRAVLQDLPDARRAAMADAGRRRAAEEFGRPKMAGRFGEEIRRMRAGPRREFVEWRDLLLMLGVLGVAFTGLLTWVLKKLALRSLRAG